MPTKGWNELRHKSTPERLARARRKLRWEIVKGQVGLFPERVAQGVGDAWRYGKLALFLAVLSIAACVIAIWEGLS